MGQKNTVLNMSNELVGFVDKEFHYVDANKDLELSR